MNTLRKRIAQILNNNDLMFFVKQDLDASLQKFRIRDSAGHSWSQYGEDDVLIRELAPYMQNGFYINIGANHPMKLSNTYRLYCHGMRGITVEPNLVLSVLHARYRSEDIQLCAGVSDKDGFAQFFRLDNHVLSTFSADECEVSIKNGCKLVSLSLVPVFTLRTIISQCPMHERPVFAFLSIDTEALDEIVLHSNDWTKFQPKLIAVENNEDRPSLKSYLRELSYERIAKFGVNEIYKSQA